MTTSPQAITHPLIYLDNNATTRVADEVREAMLPFLGELYGNPSSVYTLGGQVARHLDAARAEVAALLGCEPSEILFTSCATESISTAIHGTLEANPRRRHIVTSPVEHLAARNPIAWLEKRATPVTWLTVDGAGRLDLAELRAALRDDTALVSLLWANNETGTLFPIAEAAALARERGAVVHVDAVQVAGKLPIDVARLPVDLLTLSGHKFHAPKGVGVLYIRRGTRLRPLLLGGHQERSRRGGTENVAGIVGIGVAARLARERLSADSARIAALRDRLESGILARIPETRVNGDPAARIPNTTNISFRYVQGEAVLLALDELGICASTGSACTTGQVELSHVLRAMNVPFTFAQGSVRFSLGRYTTGADIDRTLGVLPGIIAKLRALSPIVPEELSGGASPDPDVVAP